MLTACASQSERLSTYELFSIADGDSRSASVLLCCPLVLQYYLLFQLATELSSFQFSSAVLLLMLPACIYLLPLSSVKTLGEAFANALVIVISMGTLTFGIVLLYRYQCMFCLKGYLIFSFTLLLVRLKATRVGWDGCTQQCVRRLGVVG